MSAPYIQIDRVAQTFRTKRGNFPALRDISLTVQQGEFVTLIGHSGCGKSTLLNLIAGLTRPTAGVLLCDNREIAEPGPERAVDLSALRPGLLGKGPQVRKRRNHPLVDCQRDGAIEHGL